MDGRVGRSGRIDYARGFGELGMHERVGGGGVIEEADEIDIGNSVAVRHRPFDYCF